MPEKTDLEIFDIVFLVSPKIFELKDQEPADLTKGFSITGIDMRTEDAFSAEFLEESCKTWSEVLRRLDSLISHKSHTKDKINIGVLFCKDIVSSMDMEGNLVELDNWTVFKTNTARKDFDFSSLFRPRRAEWQR